MASIQHTFRRRGGTYVLRKRIRFGNRDSQHISYSLQTKQSSVARVRAAAACAALDRVVAMINQDQLLIGSRSASELSEIARRAMDAQLGLALQDQIEAPGEDANAAALVFADYYTLAAKQHGPVVLGDEDRAALVRQGRSARHIQKLELLISHNRTNQPMSDAHLRLQLERFGAEFIPVHADIDRLIVLNAMAEAQRRAPMFQTSTLSVHDAIEMLLNVRAGHSHEARLDLPAMQVPMRAPSVAGSNIEPEPVVSDKPLLSEIAEQTVNRIVAQGKWNSGPNSTADDALRLVRQLIWMIGDKPVDQYTQTDIANFASELWDLPKTVRAQTVWHRPYSTVKLELGTAKDSSRRNARTINKDLSYLATFAQRMESDGYWTKGKINPLLLSHVVTKTQKTMAKAPWKKSDIEKMMACPIYTGNAGPKRRLKPGPLIHQDAAYWLLLLAVYTAGCQNELAGLLLDDIVADGIPHIVIRPNRLRSLKREARERFIALHPRLISLGFLDYVSELRIRGATELFEELWLNAGKRGADQYRAIVWNKIVRWLKAEGVSIPIGRAGKEADFHSLRSSVLSLLDRADINQNIVKDIAGHAREGVTADSYQKLQQTGGLDDALNEQKLILNRLPDFARHIRKVRPMILHPDQRSR